MLKEGTKAPEFELLNQKGESIALKNYLGQKLVVYFYPKDDTPGCTTQACNFRDAYEDYSLLNVPIIGISMDSVDSHASFAASKRLPFDILADITGETVRRYDVWHEKERDGNKYMGIVRTTYLIDERGFIEKVYEKADPEENTKEILEYLKKS